MLDTVENREIRQYGRRSRIAASIIYETVFWISTVVSIWVRVRAEHAEGQRVTPKACGQRSRTGRKSAVRSSSRPAARSYTRLSSGSRPVELWVRVRA